MRLVVTGGGTGGHVYPALEVGRLASARGAELTYLGSLRGQEGTACRQLGVEFYGFPSAPLYSLRQTRGWISLVGLLRSVGLAKKRLRSHRPDAVFSTGGYSAAPVVSAARSLRIPYVIHESNSVPGRTNLMFAPQAHAFTCVFRSTVEKYSKGAKVTRTGQPIRRELRDAAKDRIDADPMVLVLGGSQGSAFLNDTVPQAHVRGVRFVHAVGKSNVGRLQGRVWPSEYEIHAFLETPQLLDAYRRATVVVARSGGTLAEVAMFGLPSVLVPLPSSADDHQHHNAEEFVAMHAATLVPQAQATPVKLREAICGWLDAPEKRNEAARQLAKWDVPDATERIVGLIEAAAKRKG